MRLIGFKKQYLLPIDESQTLIIDPIDRIRRGLKTSTLRKAKMPPGPYRPKQGSRFKPEIIREFYLRIYRREAVTIQGLSKWDIQADLGLATCEFDAILKNNPEIRLYFLQGIQRINKDTSLTLQTRFFLYPFRKVDFQRSTLDRFIQEKPKDQVQVGTCCICGVRTGGGDFCPTCELNEKEARDESFRLHDGKG